jgi:hypothetical protein
MIIKRRIQDRLIETKRIILKLQSRPPFWRVRLRVRKMGFICSDIHLINTEVWLTYRQAWIYVVNSEGHFGNPRNCDFFLFVSNFLIILTPCSIWLSSYVKCTDHTSCVRIVLLSIFRWASPVCHMRSAPCDSTDGRTVSCGWVAVLCDSRGINSRVRTENHLQPRIILPNTQKAYDISWLLIIFYLQQNCQLFWAALQRNWLNGTNPNW